MVGDGCVTATLSPAVAMSARHVSPRNRVGDGTRGDLPVVAGEDTVAVVTGFDVCRVRGELDSRALVRRKRDQRPVDDSPVEPERHGSVTEAFSLFVTVAATSAVEFGATLCGAVRASTATPVFPACSNGGPVRVTPGTAPTCRGEAADDEQRSENDKCASAYHDSVLR